MADSIRETVVQEVVSRVTPAAGIGNRCFRSRTEMVARAEMPAAIVKATLETPTQLTSACKIDKRLRVVILLCTHADTPDQVADAIITDIHKRIMPTIDGVVDLTLGGLPGVQDVEEAGLNFSIEGWDGVTAMEYDVKYRHSQGDPSVL